jgi:hypothetical protein
VCVIAMSLICAIRGNVSDGCNVCVHIFDARPAKHVRTSLHTANDTRAYVCWFPRSFGCIGFRRMPTYIRASIRTRRTIRPVRIVSAGLPHVRASDHWDITFGTRVLMYMSMHTCTHACMLLNKTFAASCFECGRMGVCTYIHAHTREHVGRQVSKVQDSGPLCIVSGSTTTYTRMSCILFETW